MPKGKRIKSHRKKKKLPWTPMQISRVPLDPQQAVLTCCDSLSRAAGRVGGHQCEPKAPCGDRSDNAYAS